MFLCHLFCFCVSFRFIWLSNPESEIPIENWSFVLAKVFQKLSKNTRETNKQNLNRIFETVSEMQCLISNPVNLRWINWKGVISVITKFIKSRSSSTSGFSRHHVTERKIISRVSFELLDIFDEKILKMLFYFARLTLLISVKLRNPKPTQLA